MWGLLESKCFDGETPVDVTGAMCDTLAFKLTKSFAHIQVVQVKKAAEVLI